jgi:hypothetical protein
VPSNRNIQDLGALRKEARVSRARPIFLEIPSWGLPTGIPEGVSWLPWGPSPACFAREGDVAVGVWQAIPEQTRQAIEAEVKRLLPERVEDHTQAREQGRQAARDALDAEARALGLDPEAIRARVREEHARRAAAAAVDPIPPAAESGQKEDT